MATERTPPHSAFLLLGVVEAAQLALHSQPARQMAMAPMAGLVVVRLMTLEQLVAPHHLDKEMQVAPRQEISMTVELVAAAVVPAALDITHREMEILRTVVTVEMDLQIQ